MKFNANFGVLFIAERKLLASGVKTIRFYDVPKLAMPGGYFIDTWVSLYFPFFLCSSFLKIYFFNDSSFDFTQNKIIQKGFTKKILFSFYNYL